MRSSLAIIPARGGSVRLPRKNIAEFLGRPIIAHTITAALQSGCFSNVVVSTDDPEIASVAMQFGAKVHDRAPELATSTATVVEVCLDVLECEERAGRRHDWFACLYATAPLRTADHIRAVAGLLEADDCCFAIAVTTYSLPPHQAMKLTGESRLTAMWPELVDLRAADVGTLVVDNGSTYAVDVAAFRRERSFFGSGLRGYLMPRRCSVDIDEAEDLQIARMFAETSSQ